jgi:hypothetical protein
VILGLPFTDQALTQSSGETLDGLTLISEKCHMPHFPARADRAFTIQMYVSARKIQKGTTFGSRSNRRDIISDEINHGSRAQQSDLPQRHPAYRSHLLFKLRHTARI